MKKMLALPLMLAMAAGLFAQPQQGAPAGGSPAMSDQPAPAPAKEKGKKKMAKKAVKKAKKAKKAEAKKDAATTPAAPQQ